MILTQGARKGLPWPSSYTYTFIGCKHFADIATQQGTYAAGLCLEQDNLVCAAWVLGRVYGASWHSRKLAWAEGSMPCLPCEWVS